MDKIQHDILRVKELGELIGYGNMMSLASALWRKKLIESGTPPSGAFIAALEMDIEAEQQHLYETESKHFDNLIMVYEKDTH